MSPAGEPRTALEAWAAIPARLPSLVANTLRSVSLLLEIGALTLVAILIAAFQRVGVAWVLIGVAVAALALAAFTGRLQSRGRAMSGLLASRGVRAKAVMPCICLVAVALLAAAAPASAVWPDYVRIVGNQSSREGAKPRLIVLHVTTDASSASRPVVRNRPGLKDLKELGRWFDDPRSAVSSHVANDADGNDAQYVRDRRKAWTQVAFNSVGLSIEQIAKTDFTRRKWMHKRVPQLKNTARWIAHWHRKWNIPLRRAEVSGSVATRSGIATHEQLGRAGGGHRDPGPGYPFGHVLKLAKKFSSRALGG